MLAGLYLQARFGACFFREHIPEKPARQAALTVDIRLASRGNNPSAKPHGTWAAAGI